MRRDQLSNIVRRENVVFGARGMGVEEGNLFLLVLQSIHAHQWSLQRPWYRQRREQLAVEALGLELRRKLVGDVPGENHRAVRLIGIKPRFAHHRDPGAGHALPDL